MVEWFFFNGVNTKTAGTSIGGQHNLVIFPGAHETQPPLAFLEMTESWADVALDAAILEFMPILCGVLWLIFLCHILCHIPWHIPCHILSDALNLHY